MRDDAKRISDAMLGAIAVECPATTDLNELQEGDQVEVVLPSGATTTLKVVHTS